MTTVCEGTHPHRSVPETDMKNERKPRGDVGDGAGVTRRRSSSNDNGRPAPATDTRRPRAAGTSEVATSRRPPPAGALFPRAPGTVTRLDRLFGTLAAALTAVALQICGGGGGGRGDGLTRGDATFQPVSCVHRSHDGDDDDGCGRTLLGLAWSRPLERDARSAPTFVSHTCTFQVH